MTTSQYLDDAKNAQEAIHGAGGQLLLEKPAITTVDGRTDTESAGTPRRYPCWGVFTPGGKRGSSTETPDAGTLDARAEQTVTIAALDFPADILPEFGDTLTSNGIVWRVLRVKTLCPDGQQMITHACAVAK